MERMDCQGEATESEPSPVLYEAPASFGFPAVFHIDLGAIEECAAWRLESLRSRPLAMRLLLPEFWLGLWGAVSLLQILLRLRYSSVPVPALVGQPFLPFGLVLLHMAWSRLASGLVLLRLRRQGVLQDLHLAGERPILVYGAIRHRLATRMGTWAILVVAPMFLHGLLDPMSRGTMLWVLGGIVFFAWLANGLHRRWSTPSRAVALKVSDAWVFACRSDSIPAALWNFARVDSIQLLAGITYVAWSLSPSVAKWLLPLVIIPWLAGAVLRRRLARIDLAAFERLYTAWCLREDGNDALGVTASRASAS